MKVGEKKHMQFRSLSEIIPLVSSNFGVKEPHPFMFGRGRHNSIYKPTFRLFLLFHVEVASLIIRDC